MIQDNIPRLREFMKNKRIDCAIISGIDSTIPDLYYYTGFIDSGLNFLIITKNDIILYCWDTDKAKRNSAVKKVISLNNMKLSDIIKKIEKDRGRIGISFDAPHRIIHNLRNKLNSAEFVDIADDLKRLRSIKKGSEIDNIRQACRVTDSIFRYIRSEDINKYNEKQIASTILEIVAKKGYRPAFETIVAGDSNSSEIHHTPLLKKFKELVLIDIGVENNEYRSDASRTFVVGGNRKMMDAKNALLNIHNDIDDYMEEGIIISELCNFVKEKLKSYGYNSSGYFNFHALGHGVGLEPHEHPSITSTSSSIFEKNMVVAIEPAIYFPGKFGIRLEDTILIKKKGIERLTKYPLNLN